MDQAEHRVVCHDEIASLGKELGCLYIETSAKSGENVELAFAVVAMLLCNQNEDYLIAPSKIKQITSSLKNLLSHSNE